MDGERLGNAMNVLHAWLQRHDLAPDETRRDWGEFRADLETVHGHAEEVAAALEALLPVMDPDEASQTRHAASEQIADAAALLHVSGDRTRARVLLQRAVELAAGVPEAQLVREADQHFGDYIQLVHAWWLFRQERRDEALAVARRLAPRASGQIKVSAQALVDAPEPISKAPALGTLNGFGLTLYGRRNPGPDGAYTATRFLAAIFVPVLPLDAWRVAAAPEGGFYFLGKVPLSGLTRTWRRLALMTVVAAVAAGA